MMMMVFAELIGGVVLYEKGWNTWIWETDPTAAGMGAGVLLLFGLMPWLLMGIEKAAEEEKSTSHGHEKKPLIEAV